MSVSLDERRACSNSAFCDSSEPGVPSGRRQTCSHKVLLLQLPGVTLPALLARLVYQDTGRLCGLWVESRMKQPASSAFLKAVNSHLS